MLIAEPTKYGAGVTIYGDYWDLNELHQTIHYLSGSSVLGNHHSDFVLGLAYDIRHAYQRDRKEKTFGYDEYDKVKYRGVDILWPVILVQSGLLRWSAGFVPTGKKHQANLYQLESSIEESLDSFDPVVGPGTVWIGCLDSQDFRAIILSLLCLTAQRNLFMRVRRERHVSRSSRQFWTHYIPSPKNTENSKPKSKGLPTRRNVIRTIFKIGAIGRNSVGS